MKSAAERAAEKIIQFNDYAISMSSVTEVISREYAELEQAAASLTDALSLRPVGREQRAKRERDIQNAWESTVSALAKVRGQQ